MTDSPLQLRLVVETEDFDAALAFYRDALGMPELEAYTEGDAQVVILSVPSAVTTALEAAGATVLAPPTVTPWNSLNARLEAPGASGSLHSRN